MIAISIPLLAPILIQITSTILLHINNQCANTSGSIDGWLGYLGGYSGGFLAFISALIIFTKQKSQNEKCWLTWSAIDADIQKEQTVYMSAIYTEQKVNQIQFDIKTRAVLNWPEYGVAIIKVKNVSNNYAKYVNITMRAPYFGSISPICHQNDSSSIGPFEHLAELGPTEEFEFALYIDPKLIKIGENIVFELETTSLTEAKNKQIKKAIYKNKTIKLIN